MSSDLFELRVIDLDPEGRRVRLRVYVVYYDITVVDGHVTETWAQPLPRDASFFFRVLWGAYWDNHGVEGRTPIGDAVVKTQIHDNEWVNANTARFVERVDELTRRNDPPDEGDWLRMHRHYYQGDPDGDRDDELHRVQADYDLWVTDERWLEHLDPDESWGTAYYPTHASGFHHTTSQDGIRWTTYRIPAG